MSPITTSESIKVSVTRCGACGAIALGGVLVRNGQGTWVASCHATGWDAEELSRMIAADSVQEYDVETVIGSDPMSHAGGPTPDALAAIAAVKTLNQNRRREGLMAYVSLSPQALQEAVDAGLYAFKDGGPYAGRPANYPSIPSPAGEYDSAYAPITVHSNVDGQSRPLRAKPLGPEVIGSKPFAEGGKYGADAKKDAKGRFLARSRFQPPTVDEAGADAFAASGGNVGLAQSRRKPGGPGNAYPVASGGVDVDDRRRRTGTAGSWLPDPRGEDSD